MRCTNHPSYSCAMCYSSCYATKRRRTAIVSRMIGSKGRDSTIRMASFRGWLPGARQKSERPAYTPIQPRDERSPLRCSDGGLSTTARAPKVARSSTSGGCSVKRWWALVLVGVVASRPRLGRGPDRRPLKGDTPVWPWYATSDHVSPPPRSEATRPPEIATVAPGLRRLCSADRQGQSEFAGGRSEKPRRCPCEDPSAVQRDLPEQHARR